MLYYCARMVEEIIRENAEKGGRPRSGGGDALYHHLKGKLG